MSGHKISVKGRPPRNFHERPVYCGPFKHAYFGQIVQASVFSLRTSRPERDPNSNGEADRYLLRYLHDMEGAGPQDRDWVTWSIGHSAGPGCTLQYGGFEQRPFSADFWDRGDRPTGREAADLGTVLETVVLPRVAQPPLTVEAHVLDQSGEGGGSLDDTDVVQVTVECDWAAWFSLTIAWGRIHLKPKEETSTILRRLLFPLSMRRCATARKIVAAVSESLASSGKPVAL